MASRRIVQDLAYVKTGSPSVSTIKGVDYIHRIDYTWSDDAPVNAEIVVRPRDGADILLARRSDDWSSTGSIALNPPLPIPGDGLRMRLMCNPGQRARCQCVVHAY